MVSRVARKPITIPKGVEIKIDGQKISVKGPKGQFDYDVPACVNVNQADDRLEVISGDSKTMRLRGRSATDRFAGTTRANLSNLIVGVSTGFEKKLELRGVGYRGQVKGKALDLSLGFSHPVLFDIPEGIVIEMPTPTEISVKGADRHLVGQVAANIRKIRPVECYKGKGVRYVGENVVLREVKKK